MDVNLNKLQKIVEDREAWRAAVYGVTSWTQLSKWTMTNSFLPIDVWNLLCASLLHVHSTVCQSWSSHTRFRVALPNLPPRFQPLLHLLAHRHVELMLSETRLIPSSVLCIFSLKPVLPVFPTSLHPSILLLSPETRRHLCCFPFPHPHIQSLRD